MGDPTNPATGPEATTSPTWSVGARVFVSLLILFHGAAICAGVWGAPPSSPLEHEVANLFAPYHELIDQGYSYRYYIDPPPTPIIEATVKFADGHEQQVRIPDPAVRPRLLYQRQLALANSLSEDFQAALQSGNGGQTRWGRVYARHLGKVHPGAKTVTLRRRFHLIPEIDEVRQELSRSLGRKRLDLDSERFYTALERIGEFPCDGS